ncbi:hypothetical protein Ciccas_002114 [Cichlidogyrus casuarinus]|uniref:Uncharacterized protein n=1 Tax=Cichlidogyrus casuarinus TaxID=1844966 RepID=A0ABD2QIE5_9PLAT
MRFSQQSASIDVSPSLRFEVVASRGCPLLGLNVTLKVQNVFPLQEETARFCLSQISCASRKWKIQSVSCAANEACWLERNQNVTLLLGLIQKVEDDENLFHDMTLLPDQPLINSNAAPHADFFIRSGCQWQRDKLRPRQCFPREEQTLNPDSKVDPKALDLALLVFWQFQILSPDCPPSCGTGQSHVDIRQLNRPVRVPMLELDAIRPKAPQQSLNTAILPTLPSLLTASENRSTLPIAADAEMDKKLESIMWMSKLVRCKLLHPHSILHKFQRNDCASAEPIMDFDAEFRKLLLDEEQTSESSCGGCSLAKVEVQLHVVNTTESNLLLRVECASPEYLASQDRPRKLPHLLWIGSSLRQFQLGPKQLVSLNLQARAPRPGLYEVNCLNVKAALLTSEWKQGDSVSFMRQEFAPSSSILVNAL